MSLIGLLGVFVGDGIRTPALPASLARRGRCVGGLSDGDAGPEAHFTRLCYGSREREIARKREIMRERQE